MRAGDAGQFLGELAQQGFSGEHAAFRPHRSGVQLRNVEQAVEQVVHRFERRLQFFRERAVGRRQTPFQEGRTEQPGGIEGLQQVMIGGGEKLRLRQVRPFRLRLRAPQRVLDGETLGVFLPQPGVQVGQSRGSVAHRLQNHRRLKQREGVALNIHAALDPVHQDAVDLSQFDALTLERGDAIGVHRLKRRCGGVRCARIGHRGISGPGAGAGPIAIPVRV